MRLHLGKITTTSIFAAALHLGWTPADGVPREESWHVRQGQFEFFAVRVRRRADYVICGEM